MLLLEAGMAVLVVVEAAHTQLLPLNMAVAILKPLSELPELQINPTSPMEGDEASRRIIPENRGGIRVQLRIGIDGEQVMVSRWP